MMEAFYFSPTFPNPPPSTPMGKKWCWPVLLLLYNPRYSLGSKNISIFDKFVQMKMFEWKRVLVKICTIYSNLHPLVKVLSAIYWTVYSTIVQTKSIEMGKPTPPSLFLKHDPGTVPTNINRFRMRGRLCMTDFAN